MYSVKEVIIVEGNYDKIKLSGFIESPVFAVNGFRVFKDADTQNAIKTFAEKTGVVILTDSDSAGLKIRAFIRGLIKKGIVFDAFVPEIHGKERRKTVGGKEGLLGVEGIDENVIIDAIKRSGAEVLGKTAEKKMAKPLTKADFYKMGISGGENSAKIRKGLLKELGLPTKMSANMLISVIDRLLNREELYALVDKIKKM